MADQPIKVEWTTEEFLRLLAEAEATGRRWAVTALRSREASGDLAEVWRNLNGNVTARRSCLVMADYLESLITEETDRA